MIDTVAFVLIIVTQLGNVQMQEFASEASCKKALQHVIGAYVDKDLEAMPYDVSCLPK